VCEADEWPFHPFEGVAWGDVNGVEDREVLEAMQSAKDFQRVFYEQNEFWGEAAGRLKIKRAGEFFVRK
jgi:hypothetical protein